MTGLGVSRTARVLWLVACSPQPQATVIEAAASCPPRSLVQQFARANVIAEGLVTYDRICKGPRFDGDRPIFDCVGRRADVVVRKVWKGRLRKGDGLGLVTPAPAESAGMNLRKGDAVILFVRTQREFDPEGRTQWGFTDACMHPSGFKTAKRLAEALDSLRDAPGPS